MLTRMLKIVSIGEVEKAKNGREYRTVLFSPFNLLPNGAQVFSNQSPGTRVIFGSYTDDRGNVFKADGLWEDINAGRAGINGAVEGTIQRFVTTPYSFEDGKVAESYTAVVFSNEDPVTYVNKSLRDRYACAVVNDVLTAPHQLTRPAAVPVSETTPTVVVEEMVNEVETLN